MRIGVLLAIVGVGALSVNAAQADVSHGTAYGAATICRGPGDAVFYPCENVRRAGRLVRPDLSVARRVSV